MRLKRLDKKIINFIYSLQQTPGFTKKQSLLSEFKVSEKKFNASIKRLLSHEYIKEFQGNTSHNGVCYELTKTGLELWKDIDKSLLEKIQSNITKIEIYSILGFIVSYFLYLFSEEIKIFIINLINFKYK